MNRQSSTGKEEFKRKETMNIYSISVQSLKRRRTKTFFLIFGLVLAVSSVVALTVISKNMSESVSKDLDEYGANIIITPKSNELALNYGSLSIGELSYDRSNLFESDVDKIKEIKNFKNISVISPKLLVVDKIDSLQTLIAGIKFDKEYALKKWWKIDGRIPEKASGVLLGSEASTKLKLNLNDKILIKGTNFSVVGVIQPTGSQDDAMVFIDLHIAQQLFDKGENLSLIELSALCYDCPVEEIVRQISQKLPNAKVSAIRQSIDSKMAAVAKFEDFSFGISIVILIISLLIVFTNVNSSLNERIREIGVFKAIGFRNRDIFKIVFFEVLIASGIAGLLGYLIGIAAANIIMPLLDSNAVIGFKFDPEIFLIASMLSIVVGIMAAFYPAYKATKLDPTVAFRTL
ncbi:MAG TPA: ABC transporter permease [Ignavibacteriales bacterium]|nr:ABC transporter permease [Ignavibacteriales bacterium]